MKAGIGLAIVVAHAIGFIVAAPRCRRAELEVSNGYPNMNARREPEGIGLEYVRWVARYRGGYTRTAGSAAIVGRKQDPEAHECVGRVVVGQRMLDDGSASPGTFAGELARVMDAELRGETVVGLGDYKKVEAVSLMWAELGNHPEDISLIYAAPYGYVRARATIVFDRVSVPLVLALILEPSAEKLNFRILARAELAFDNRVVQWLSDKLGGNRLATRLARDQIDASLVSALSPPPPFQLPDGQTLVFGYCNGPPEIRENASGSLPFSVAIGRADQRDVLPPRFGPIARYQPLDRDTKLAIDLNMDGLNAILYELWRGKFLDRRLADAGLDRRFNTDPTVQEFLSLRITSPTLALPPVIAHTGTLGLYADARVTIADGPTTTIGRVWGRLDFAFAPQTLRPIGVDLGTLDLTCERTPDTLVPCYADLVAALRDRSADFNGALTQAFSTLLTQIFVDRRLHGEGMPADLVIRAVSPTVTSAQPLGNGYLRLALDGVLVRTP
jgi:hypothetical protein